MCIIILNKEGTIPFKRLDKSWDNNSHGAGMMWVEDGQLNIYKTSLKELFLTKYYSIRSRTEHPIVMHFRVASVGKITKENMHPFSINDNLAFAHNGTFEGNGDKGFSDTYKLCEVLKGYVGEDNSVMKLKPILDFMCGTKSKLVFMNNEGRYLIINHKAGIWDDGNWYSNNSYKIDKYPKTNWDWPKIGFQQHKKVTDFYY